MAAADEGWCRVAVGGAIVVCSAGTSPGGEDARFAASGRTEAAVAVAGRTGTGTVGTGGVVVVLLVVLTLLPIMFSPSQHRTSSTLPKFPESNLE